MCHAQLQNRAGKSLLLEIYVLLLLLLLSRAAV
jgi:hypothetical protein